jgi:hypothetical protein
MAVLKRGEVAAPTLPKQTVEVSALGGEVIVQGLLLTQRLAVQGKIAALSKGATELDDSAALHAVLPMLLALCVVDAEGAQFFTPDQWEVFGASHQGSAIELFNIAWRLSGFAQAEVAKN